jgi:hypothetical protein
LLYTTLTAHDTTLKVIVVISLMAIGMGNVMAPATESIMGSLPRAKAGVGSAMNDTTRQMGGAIGVAVLGSLLASRFTSQMVHLLNGRIPTALLNQVKGGIGQATGVVSTAPQARPFAGTITRAAQTSFVSGMHLAAVAAAGIIAVAAIGVLVWLPARAASEEPIAAPTSDDGAEAPVAVTREAS